MGEKNRRQYKVRVHDRECSLCFHFDSIKEPVVYGERGKQRIFICRLDHLEVERIGVCDEWNRRSK